MANAEADWWKAVPCHFTWQLEEGTDKDYYTLKNSLESKLNQSEYGMVATLLLFRSYLPMSSFKYSCNGTLEEAIEYLDKADDAISEISDVTAKRAHVIVLLANRLWTLEKNTTATEDVKRTYEEKLSKVWETSETRSKDLYANFDAIAGFALMRLGPGKRDEAEKRFRQAVKSAPNNPLWLYNLGQLIGRQARQMAVGSTASDPRMTEEREFYEQSLEVDPTREEVRCALAQVLFRLGEVEDAEKEFSKLKDTNSKVIIEKGRFYRKLRQFDKALEILRKGENIEAPRGEIYMQISLVYNAKAWEAGQSRDWEEKNRFHRKEIEFIDQCLNTEPTHFRARLNRAKAYSMMRENAEAERLFRYLLDDTEMVPINKLELKVEFAKFLAIRNRKRMTQEVAKLYKEVLEEAVEKCTVTGADGRLTFLEAKRLVDIAKEKLLEFHGRRSAKGMEIINLLKDISL